MDENLKYRPVTLCVLDGWGSRIGGDDNAIFHANTPNWDRMTSTYPTSTLKASETEVGLPSGQMGNSEVGHMNLGAGRVVMQDLPLIDQAISNRSIANSSALIELISKTKRSKGTCHFLGLVSPGGVHSLQNHLVSLAKILDKEKIPIKLHAFLDGRDTGPITGRDFIFDLMRETEKLKNFSIATIMGRYWAMDRDNNWDRIQKAYSAIAKGEGLPCENAPNLIQESYDNGVTDEFINPIILGKYSGIKPGDSMLMFNFRSDRARQIISSFVDPKFAHLEKKENHNLITVVTMTEYSTYLNEFVDVLFPPRKLRKTLGQVVSDAKLTQLRAAETEKYAHVTFFFNGGREETFPGEERILIPSPKVDTYALKPEMSANELTNNIVAAIESERFDLIVTNFANCDMGGHTGIFDAAVQAVETIDKCLGQIEEAIIHKGGAMLITADHGNVEQMRESGTENPHTAHTVSAVPLVLVNPPKFVAGIQAGRLADVAPTLLRLLGLEQPSEMTGKSLIMEKNA